jgi:hypothetical protein
MLDMLCPPRWLLARDCEPEVMPANALFDEPPPDVRPPDVRPPVCPAEPDLCVAAWLLP